MASQEHTFSLLQRITGLRSAPNELLTLDNLPSYVCERLKKTPMSDISNKTHQNITSELSPNCSTVNDINVQTCVSHRPGDESILLNESSDNLDTAFLDKSQLDIESFCEEGRSLCSESVSDGVTQGVRGIVQLRNYN